MRSWAGSLIAIAAFAACSSDGERGGGTAGVDAGGAATAGAGPAGAAGRSGSGGATSSGGSSGDAASGGSSGDAGSGGVSGSSVSLPAVASCAPSATACAPAPSDTGIHATYRKDFFLPKSSYDEPLADPISGGRVTIVAYATAGGNVAKVSIDGQEQLSISGAGASATVTLPANDKLDWITVWPRKVTAGEPLWVAFHSRQDFVDHATSLPIEIALEGGAIALSGSFPIQKAEVSPTYVTTNESRDLLYVHVANVAASPRSLAKLIVDGKDVTEVACIPEKTLAPNSRALWTVPLCAAKAPGSLWSVRIELADGPSAVTAGRVILPHFPIHTWPSSADCPFPGADAAAHQEHVAHGFDTFYVRGGVYDDDDCSALASDAAVQNLAAAGLYSMPVVGVGKGTYDAFSRVAARFVGDEADATNEAGIAAATRNKVTQSLSSWLADPEIPTYVGGSRNRWMGTFSGVTDLQGMDFYVAACAPHITAFGKHPPLRGAYDYLRAAVVNHAPLPTWLYTQGLSEVWDTELAGVTTYRQPDATELRIQAMSVIAAGGKGLMYFQTKLTQAGKYPDTWSAIGAFNRDVRSIRRLLRESDTTGLATASGNVIVEALRHTEAIIVPLISLEAQSGPTDLECAIPLANPHWVLADQQVDVTVDVPKDLAVADVFEIRSGTLIDPSVVVNGRQLTLPGVALSNAEPVRLFVLASSKSLRSEVAAAFQ